MLRNREELDAKIRSLLRINQKSLGVQCREPDQPADCFIELIAAAHAKAGQRVVVLVDEYNKPMLNNILQPEVARELRDGLRNLYSVIKDTDAHIKFAMLTGVSTFSRVSLFSGLNHLKDITLDARYSAICGYTDADLDEVFAPELPVFDRDELRHWYNGYNWTGESVYNPFDVLLLFDCQQFKPHWFDTGTPTLLIDLLVQRGIFTPGLEHRLSSMELLSAFDVEYIDTDALLFQAGYLYIDGHVRVYNDSKAQLPKRFVMVFDREGAHHSLVSEFWQHRIGALLWQQDVTQAQRLAKAELG